MISTHVNPQPIFIGIANKHISHHETFTKYVKSLSPSPNAEECMPTSNKMDLF